MNDSRTDSPATAILNASVQAVTPTGDRLPVEVRGERIGPPARAMHSPDTSFRITARYAAAPADENSAASDVTVCHEAASVWAAMTAVRQDLEHMGMILLIAAARRDSYAVFSPRYADSTVVNRLHDYRSAEGLLVAAPAEEVGTVAEQQQRYEQWLHDQGRMHSGNSAP